MTPQQIGKVWSVVGLAMLYYALNTWIVTQGGQEIFGAKLVISHRFPAAMVGIPICAVLLFIGSSVGLVYANRSGPAWHNRIPIVGFEAIDTDSQEGKVYQGAMIALLSGLPVVALAHFWSVFNRAPLVTAGNTPQEIKSIWDWSALTSWDDPARLCVAYSPGSASACEKGVTILPGFEPTLFAVITAVALIVTLVYWRAVFLR
jgi:hypothetical protein